MRFSGQPRSRSLFGYRSARLCRHGRRSDSDARRDRAERAGATKGRQAARKGLHQRRFEERRDRQARRRPPMPALAIDAAHGSPTESAPAPDAQKDGKAAPAGAAKKEADATDAKDETAWRGRISEARDDLRRNEVFAEALQSRINALTTDFAARDNPIERSPIADERQKALAKLDRVKGDIEKSKKKIADIEEDARARPEFLRAGCADCRLL